MVAVNVAVFALARDHAHVHGSHSWPLQLLVGTIVRLLWFQLAFTLANKPERFLQTATAIFGANTLFLPALIPWSPRCCRTSRSEIRTMRRLRR